MHKRLILLLGVFLGSYAPVMAQTPAPQIISAQYRTASILAIVRTLPAPSLAPSFPRCWAPVLDVSQKHDEREPFIGATQAPDSL